jgi:NitT/TauT family transport system substrate-binding protein
MLARRRFCRAAIGLTSSALVGAACSEPLAPLSVGSNTWPGYEPLYVARDRGELPRELRLVELVSASQVMRAMRNGLLDAGCLTLDESLRLASETNDVELVAVVDLSQGADAVLGRDEVRTLADLRGRRVGVEKSAVGAYLLARAVERAGLAVSDVSAVYIPVQEHRSAFDQRRVDALVTFEPVLGALREQGANVLMTSADIPGEIVDVLAVRRSVARARRADVARLVESWYSARDSVVRSVEDGAPLTTARLGRDPALLRHAYDGMILPDRPRSRTLLGQGPESLRATAERLVAAMVRIGLLTSPIEPSVVFPDEAWG